MRYSGIGPDSLERKNFPSKNCINKELKANGSTKLLLVGVEHDSDTGKWLFSFDHIAAFPNLIMD